MQSTVQVTINIVDVNDNTPVITPSSYVVSIKENLPAGQSVVRVSTDKPVIEHLYGQLWTSISSRVFHQIDGVQAKSSHIKDCFEFRWLPLG